MPSIRARIAAGSSVARVNSAVDRDGWGLIPCAASRSPSRVKTWRGPATRYDKTPQSYEAGLHLRGSIMWLKLLTSTTLPATAHTLAERFVKTMRE